MPFQLEVLAIEDQTCKSSGPQNVRNPFNVWNALSLGHPILAYADLPKPFVLYTDASNQVLGAVLAQVQDCKERVIACASKSLHPTEWNDKNYSSSNWNLFSSLILTLNLALKWAITEKLKDFLMGAKFAMYTDNSPVAHVQNAGLGVGAEQCWVTQVASFDFEVKYRAGKKNANALSRFPADCLDLGILRKYIEQGTLPDPSMRKSLPSPVRKFLHQWRRLQFYGSVLCWEVRDPNTNKPYFQILYPAERLEVWNKYHEAAAHKKMGKTLSRICRCFYWPSMEGEACGFQLGCAACRLRNRDRPRAPLHGFVSPWGCGSGLSYIGEALRQVPEYSGYGRTFHMLPMGCSHWRANFSDHMIYGLIRDSFGCPARL